MQYDQTPSKDLIRVALVKESEEDYWEIVSNLRQRGNREVFEIASALCRSAQWKERELGADILGQLGAPKMPFADETLEILIDLLNNDKNPDVLGAAATATEYIKDSRIVEPLIRLKSHPYSEVRYGVVSGLLTREDEASVVTLIDLSFDPDTQVRNWATFGLAQQIDIDKTEIREALFKRLEDDNAEIRGEAILGLARREDERVIELLIKELKAIVDIDNYWDHAFEAAMEIGDARLYPVLLTLKKQNIDNRWLDIAIASCRIPTSEEVHYEIDSAETTCPVCSHKKAFEEADGLDFCQKCGWQNDPGQLADPNSRDGWNRRSLNQERERWKKRLMIKQNQSEISNHLEQGEKRDGIK